MHERDWVQGWFTHHYLQARKLLCFTPALTFLIDSRHLSFAYYSSHNEIIVSIPLPCLLLESVYLIDRVHMSFLFSCNLYVRKAQSFCGFWGSLEFLEGKARQRKEFFISCFAFCWSKYSHGFCLTWLVCCPLVHQEQRGCRLQPGATARQKKISEATRSMSLILPFTPESPNTI